MGDVVEPLQHLAGQGLPGLRIGAFLRLQMVDGAVVEPGSDNRSHHAGGVPGGRHDRALERRHPLDGRGHKSDAQSRGDILG
ncbi:hypothetical protein D3C72_2080940 [compost metagenome]